MLEVAYEAFESAGLSLESLSGSETGVYCAVSTGDYEIIQSRDPEYSPRCIKSLPDGLVRAFESSSDC
jgi:acyl transferase domain-containing protein